MSTKVHERPLENNSGVLSELPDNRWDKAVSRVQFVPPGLNLEPKRVLLPVDMDRIAAQQQTRGILDLATVYPDLAVRGTNATLESAAQLTKSLQVLTQIVQQAGYMGHRK